MTGRLDVWLGAHRAGELWRADGGGLGFRYDRDWLAHPERRALSLSLPLAEAPVVRGPTHTFFRGLLPDEPLRSQIAAKLGLDPLDDLGLLEGLGGECAGAIALHPRGVDPSRQRADYAPLTKADLAKMSEPAGIIPLLIGRTRRSLAGNQHKLPVMVRDGALHQPLGPAPTTHILKIGDPELSHLPANEVFTTLLAAEMGLPTPEVDLIETPHRPMLLAKRFDRRERHGEIVSLHQEDFHQAAGGRGEMTIADCVQLVRHHTRQPLADTHHLIRWSVFHLVAGNSGGTTRSLALLYDEHRLPMLAPFYDLVCTRAYKRLDRDLGMPIGRERDPVKISSRHWTSLAESLSLKPKTLFAIVEEVLDTAEPSLDAAHDLFRARFGDHPILRIVPVMRSQIDWIRERLH